MKVSIGAVKEITCFTQEEKGKMTDELTLDNPLYAQAMRYSGYSSISLPKYNLYYSVNKNTLIVPRGYNIPFKYTIEENAQFTLENIEYPKLKIQLRETQEEALDAYIENRESGKGVIVLPTGKGKSILGIALAHHLKQRALVIVHKDDLVDGWKADCKVALGLRPKQVGLIKGQVFRLGRWITLATVQTLARLKPEQTEELRKYFSMIIVDEFHHSASKIYEIVNTFPAKDRIGLTATDMRNDGLEKVLNFYFGDVCYRFKDSDNDEDIIPPKDVIIKIKESNVKYFVPPSYVDPKTHKIINQIKLGDNLYNIADLEYGELKSLESKKIIKRKPLNPHNIANAIQTNEGFAEMVARDVKAEYQKSKSCLVFCKEKEHVRLIQNKLISIGVPENQVQLYYGDAKESKTSMKMKAENGDCLITIATYAIATEGTNVRRWERLFLAMTFNNAKDTIQAVGRGRRTKKGKENCVVYDYSHPKVSGARNHINTRVAVYEELGFRIYRDSLFKLKVS